MKCHCRTSLLKLPIIEGMCKPDGYQRGIVFQTVGERPAVSIDHLHSYAKQPIDRTTSKFRPSAVRIILWLLQVFLPRQGNKCKWSIALTPANLAQVSTSLVLRRTAVILTPLLFCILSNLLYALRIKLRLTTNLVYFKKSILGKS